MSTILVSELVLSQYEASHRYVDTLQSSLITKHLAVPSLVMLFLRVFPYLRKSLQRLFSLMLHVANQ